MMSSLRELTVAQCLQIASRAMPEQVTSASAYSAATASANTGANVIANAHNLHDVASSNASKGG